MMNTVKNSQGNFQKSEFDKNSNPISNNSFINRYKKDEDRYFVVRAYSMNINNYRKPVSYNDYKQMIYDNLHTNQVNYYGPMLLNRIQVKETKKNYNTLYKIIAPRIEEVISEELSIQHQKSGIKDNDYLMRNKTVTARLMFTK